jgi:hypothetical protein
MGDTACTAAAEDVVSVYEYTGTLRATSQGVSGQASDSGRRMRRVCAGTPVHYEQTVGE